MGDSENTVNCDNVEFRDRGISLENKYNCIFEKDEIRVNDGGKSLSDIEETIVAKQQELFEKVNKFNKAYSCYVRKNYNDSNPNKALDPATEYECDPGDQNDYLVQLQGEDGSGGLAKEIKDLEADIQGLKNSINYDGNDVFPSGPTMNALQSKHNKIKRDRNDLDTKVKELNEGENTSAKLAKLELDTTVYFSLLWTTLAGCVIFYSLSEL